MKEQIDLAIQRGPERVAELPLAVLHEIARRYVKAQFAIRERVVARATERKAFMDRPEVRAAMDAAIFETTFNMTNVHAHEYAEDLLDTRFAVEEGGEIVTWATATIAQHNRRAAFLEGLAAGIATTALLHRQAVADLNAAGSDTLGEMLRG